MANNNTVKKKKVKMSTGDKVFTVINTVIMILVCIAIVYPLYYVLLAPVTDPVVVSSGKILLYPEAWYTNGYETTLKYQPLWTGYANTIIAMFIQRPQPLAERTEELKELEALDRQREAEAKKKE